MLWPWGLDLSLRDADWRRRRGLQTGKKLESTDAIAGILQESSTKLCAHHFRRAAAEFLTILRTFTVIMHPAMSSSLPWSSSSCVSLLLHPHSPSSPSQSPLTSFPSMTATARLSGATAPEASPSSSTISRIPSSSERIQPTAPSTSSSEYLSSRPSPTPNFHGHHRGALPSLVALVVAIAMASDIQGAPSSRDTFENVPQTLSGGDKAHRIQKPKSSKAESCTQKCVSTCIRGGAGAPGEGPLNVRRPLVVFKEGFRSRQYCLIECSEICNLIGDGDDGP